ncbi:prefoldin subunit alpha [Candidatus Woesearchaeota archaeon]|nr:prefoldin subunit alpha [Candidatus Woesearchaeota archaeon]
MTEQNRQEEDIKRRYVELQLLERQLKTLHSQIQQLEQQTAEVDEITNVLHQLAEQKPDTDILIPISQGIFFKGKLIDAKQVLVNVGSGTFIKKESAETQKDLGNQVVQMRKLAEDRAAKLQELSTYAERVQEDLKKLVEEHQ